jgi:hypothetical protein
MQRAHDEAGNEPRNGGALGGLGRFVLRGALLCLPLLASLAAYVCWDPFKVVRYHESFYPEGDPVYPNRDFASTEILLREYRRQRYDTIILGNSRSLAFRSPGLRHCLGQARRPFHFDASAESLYGLRTKAEFLDRLGLRLADALVVLDAEVLGNGTVASTVLTAKHPAVTGGSRLEFQAVFLRGFFTKLFAFKYAWARVTDRVDPWMSDVLVSKTRYGRVTQLLPANDLVSVQADEDLARDAETYVALRTGIFYQRTPGTSAPALNVERRKTLLETASFLKQAADRVEIIVSPLYDQQKMAAADVDALRTAFGASHVYDYSGVNRFTADRRNYYEASHYRKTVADEILTEVYCRR